MPRVIGGNTKAWFELAPTFGDSAERLDGRNITVRHWALPEFYLFTLGGIAGLVVSWKRRETVLLAAISVYFTITSLVFLSPPRLRAPFDLISCIGLGLLAAWWTDRRGLSPHPEAIDGTLTEVGPEPATNPYRRTPLSSPQATPSERGVIYCRFSVPRWRGPTLGTSPPPPLVVRCRFRHS